LASSECYDLALIDIEGEDLNYLGWAEAPPSEGQKVYAAGYPLGSRQFLLNGGNVVNVSPEPQASPVSAVPIFEYDAETNSGMNGGPVLSPEGKVTGVHYSTDSESGLAYGLPLTALEEVLGALSNGQNVEWIGVNGQPVVSDDGTLMGMWVYAVQPGSLAEASGILPGDLITFIGEQVLTGDTILRQYCQALREWDGQSALDLQVYRQNGDLLLEGELNGQALEVVTTAALGIQPTPAEGTPSAANLNASRPGDVYLTENFGAALTNWSRLILQGDESMVKAELENNDMLLTIDEVFTYVYYFFKPLKATDVRLDLSVENQGRNNNNISLICRYSVERGWYEFNIASNGLWWIKRYDPRVNNFIDIGKGASKLINLGQAANDYSAVCKDNKLTLYVNGKEVKTLTDNNLATGQIGYSVSSFNVTPVTVKIDQFKASVP
jgi:hypothetical protein